jgi:hypothetical protein
VTTPSERRYRVAICTSDCPRREEAETFVRDAFYRTHRARIETFMPSLLMLTDHAGSLHGVIGCRSAESGPLFLERYLGGPIEEVLTHRVGGRMRRSDIVEVGNFACRNSRVAGRFMALLPQFLLAQQFVWVTFTATNSVRRILRCLGARCISLGAAEGACVRGGRDDWGQYYASDPHVMAGYLPLARRIPGLWDAAYAD